MTEHKRSSYGQLSCALVGDVDLSFVLVRVKTRLKTSRNRKAGRVFRRLKYGTQNMIRGWNKRWLGASTSLESWKGEELMRSSRLFSSHARWSFLFSLFLRIKSSINGNAVILRIIWCLIFLDLTNSKNSKMSSKCVLNCEFGCVKGSSNDDKDDPPYTKGGTSV